MYPKAIEAVVREIPEPKGGTVSLPATCAMGTSWPPGSSGRTACHPIGGPAGPAGAAIQGGEVLMVRTVVRVIEPGIYGVPVFQERRVTDRPSL